MKYKKNSINYLKAFKLADILKRTHASNNVPQLKEESSNEKVSIVKRHFPKDGKSPPIILKTKSAATVMKNLNFEFKLLYGNLDKQHVKKDKTKKSICVSDKVVQNHILIPIIEAKQDVKSLINKDLKSNESAENKLESILTFPLFKSSCKMSESEICRINSLRKDLEGRIESDIPNISEILEKCEKAESCKESKENGFSEFGEKFQNHSGCLTSEQTLHTYLIKYLESSSAPKLHVGEDIVGYWKSLQPVLRCIKDVKFLEEKISHPFLQYSGKINCFAQYRNHLVVIDWKTSKTKFLPITNTVYPLQVAACIGALNFDQKYQHLATKGLIVVAYEDGSRASVFLMKESHVLYYWKKWLKHLKLYWELSKKNKNL
ncbi:mitochondrial genome maintenance exonuclease 1 [Caerostris darwini]|uniref:Mitochondrial genome maintenance exonuclease 1 n=1 Tax=Caerostris darwini TaxID=1538125 RepID=A0AAV4VDG2_9ARAC|nr:mitochondrial genome maintenance exonuclease 1 [Caerostris darwini]